VPVPQAAATLDATDDAAVAAELAAGLAHHKAGRLGDAEQHYWRVLGVRPDHAEANNLLGMVNLALGDSFGAAERLEKAVALAPDNPQFLCNAAVALDAVNQRERAVQHLGRAIELKPDYAEAHSNMGMVLKRMHRVFDAAVYYRRAIELRPDEPGFHYNLGNLLVDLGEHAEAEESYRRAIALRPKYSAALAALATLLEELGRADEAAKIAEQILDITPRVRDTAFHRSRGHAYKWVGKLEMAEESYRKALALDPTDIDTWEALSRTCRRTVRDSELDALVKLRRETSLDPKKQMLLDLALGRWFDDVGDDAASYGYFSSANAIARADTGHSREQDIADHEKIRSLFDPVPHELPSRPADGPQPIFIVGQPRAGKTTLEGMLTRHPRVKAAGELSILLHLGKEFSRANGLGIPGSHISQVPAQRLRDLGAAYMAFVRRIVPDGLISIDTMPPNYRQIGLLRLALPNARIVRCRREPLDHAIALYQKWFPHKSYGYTYDLADLGAHLGLYERLMSYWHQAFPGFVYDVDVSELRDESRMRELLDFCGLEWEPACLDFHESEPRLGDDPALAGRRREERRRFYQPLLAPHLAGIDPSAARG
jgi:tetratricopeptide (TPR) repeat protein